MRPLLLALALAAAGCERDVAWQRVEAGTAQARYEALDPARDWYVTSDGGGWPTGQTTTLEYRLSPSERSAFRRLAINGGATTATTWTWTAGSSAAWFTVFADGGASIRGVDGGWIPILAPLDPHDGRVDWPACLFPGRKR